jgi:glycosyltransferase involved in cell wall biosynthesis
MQRGFLNLQKIAKSKNNCKLILLSPDNETDDISSNDFSDSVKRIWKFNHYVRSLYKFIKNEKPSIVYFNFELRLFGSIKSAIKFPLLLLLIRKHTNSVVMLHALFIIQKNSKWIQFFEDDYLPGVPRFILKILLTIFIKVICNLSKKIIVNTNPQKNGLIEFYGIPKEKIEVIYLAESSDTSLSNPKKSIRFERQFSNKKIILYFGQLTPRKRIEIGIKAMDITRDSLPNHVLVIAGLSRYFKSYENMLHKLVKTLNLQKRVIFLGALDEDEVKSLYKMAESTIYTYAETPAGPSALLNSIYHCKPTILSDIDAFRDILKANEALFLESDDEQSLANAIVKISTDHELRHNLSNQMRKISKKYSLDTLAENYMKVYEAINNSSKVNL